MAFTERELRAIAKRQRRAARGEGFSGGKPRRPNSATQPEKGPYLGWKLPPMPTRPR